MKANATNKVYNINAMRPLIKALYDGGNRRVSSAKMAEEAGIDSTYYQCYRVQLEKLYDAVCGFIRVNHNPESTDAEKDSAFNKIYPIWSDLLHDAEKSKDKRDLHAQAHDIHSLIGFAERQMDNAVDDSIIYGGDKIVPRKAYGTETFKRFQKQVETDLGIKIAQIDCLTDEEAEYLRSKRKLVNKYRKAKNRKEELETSMDALKKALAEVKESDELSKQIEDIKSAIESTQSKIEEIKKELEELSAKHKKAALEKIAAQTPTSDANSKPAEQTTTNEPASK